MAKRSGGHHQPERRDLDTLAALKACQERGAKTLAVVNVVGSDRPAATGFFSLSRAGDCRRQHQACSVQIAVLYLFALRLALARGAQRMHRAPPDGRAAARSGAAAPILKDCDNIKYLASQFMNSDHLFFMGRGFDMRSLEGSLKLKEISYVHSEVTRPAAARHHLLIVEGTPVVALATQDSV
ncbi:MAG: hypothetical protein ACLRZH_07430 [Ruthenibacterium lactatiformans]